MKIKYLLIMLLVAVFAPWAAKAQSSLCDPENQLTITYELSDSNGDGWNGGQITVTDVTTESTLLDTWTILEGSFVSGSLAVCIGHEIQFSYTVSSAANENSWVIYDVTGNPIWTGSGSAGDQTETYIVVCPPCASPTDLTSTLTTGEGTIATLNWTAGDSETDWVLEYGTASDFTGATSVNVSSTPSQDLTGLTPETKYYARVKADCGGFYSTWSNVAEFTPTNYIDFTFGETASSTMYYVPFYGFCVNQSPLLSQFILPLSEVADVAGGTIRRMTFYSSNASADWGSAEFDVYVKAVEATAFASSGAEGLEDWASMTKVHSGSLSINGNQMVVEFDSPFFYSGDNLMIGFNETTPGTAVSAFWYYVNGPANSTISYPSDDPSYGRDNKLPKITFNYQPTPYKRPVIDEANCTFGATTAHIAWTVTGATPTGYLYQFKPTSASEWPGSWNEISANYADFTQLIAGTSYDFRVKAKYEGEHESVVDEYSFFTECVAVTAFPWMENFESYAAGDFSHPCWVNEHISGDGTKIFNVYTSNIGSNSTHQLQLPDQNDGTLTKLRLPEMTLPNNSYQFVIDVFRSNNGVWTDREGITVYASANGNLEGATKLAFIPRQSNIGNDTIPAVAAQDWYTYELPIPISGTCYIILKGENEYIAATYMDNLTVEQIPTCVRPSELDYDDVTNHSATISWTAGDAGQNAWQIAYSKTMFDPNTPGFDLSTVSTVDVTTNPYTFDKTLDAESTYYMYVRANCGTATEPDYGPWCRRGVSFTTSAATPAPSAFTASNFGATRADLVWAPGGGDFETSWDLYYVASTSAPEAPTEATEAIKTVSTLPTNENPYILTGLTAETRYYIWVRANHGTDGLSNWIALTGVYFETVSGCPVPTNYAQANITQNTVDLSWTGSPEVNYTVEYRISSSEAEVFHEGFEDETTFAAWTFTSMNTANDIASGKAGRLSAAKHTGNYGFSFSSYNKINGTGTYDQYLVSPELTVTGKLKFYAKKTNAAVEQLYVSYSTTNNDLSSFSWGDALSLTTDWKEFTLNLPSDAKYIAFHYFGNREYYVYVDDITICETVPAGSWIEATHVASNASTYTIEGLTASTKYDARVYANCTSDPDDESVIVTFTTLAEGMMVFTNASGDGLWGTAANWVPSVPTIADKAIIRADATITGDAAAKKITMEGAATPILTINDGGSLQTDTIVTATVKKSITAYTPGTNDHYYLIGHPFNDPIYYYHLNPTGLLTGNYDLYSWNYSASDGKEWRNFKAGSFSLLTKTGYLYANAVDVTITFTGPVRASSIDENYTLSYTPSGTYDFNGWNLVGNPFSCNAYIKDANNTGIAFYRMNTAGDGFEAASGVIKPLEGIFVQATAPSQSFKFSRTAPDTNTGNGKLNITMAQVVTSRDMQPSTDNAIIRFDEGNMLEKFSFGKGSSKIYVPQDGKDYAVVNASKVGELPLNFKAEKNGTYTLSFAAVDVDFSYLHLIDDITSTDIDLLATPSYSFDARYTDHALRFRLVFASGSSIDGDSFGFINSSGNLCIYGIEGSATLQVIDAMGRIVSNETFSGSYEKKINGSTGVYMLRLINGNDVKVQKIVVR